MNTASPPIAAAAGAWRWWTSELAAMIPWQLRARANARKTIDISVEASSTTIERIVDGVGERYVEQSDIERLDDESWAQIAELSAGRPARLVLAAPDIHVIPLDLPKQARGRLRQAVALQMNEIAPLDPSELSWAVAPGSMNGERIAASLVLAKRQRVEALRLEFEERGLPTPHVHALLADGRHIALPDLRERPEGHRRPWPAWAIAGALLASIPITTVALASALTWSNQRAVTALGDAVVAKSAEDRRWRRAETARAALLPIAREPSLAQLLDELATRLPPQISLASIERSQGNALTLVLEADDPDLVRNVLAREPRLRLSEVDEVPLEGDRMRLTYKGVLR